MQMNPSIILSGQTVDPVGSMARGAQAASGINQVKRQNALSNLYQEQGQGLLSGDQNALNALAGLDPTQALGFQTQHQANARAEKKAEMEAVKMASELSAAEAAQAKAELMGGLKMAAGLYASGDQAGFDTLMGQYGLDVPFDQFPTYALQFAPVMDALGIAEARNGGGVPDFRQVTGDEAGAMGLDPSKVYNVGKDGKVTSIGGAGVNVSVNTGSEVGTIPPGYELRTDPENGARSLHPIPGGKPALEAEQEARSQSVEVQQAREALALIEAIKTDPALPSVTGNVQGRLPAGIPLVTGGQGGADLGVKIEQLQGKSFLQAFETLKGGGQITEREGIAAQNAIARLKTSQSRDAYIAALDELEAIVQKGLDRALSGSSSSGNSVSDDDLLKMYGG
jgi:hypothetical protein